jgi:hypothetical protein
MKPKAKYNLFATDMFLFIVQRKCLKNYVSFLKFYVYVVNIASAASSSEVRISAVMALRMAG